MKTNELKEIERKAFKGALLSKGVTISELAQKLGITQSSLSASISRGISAGLYARAAAVLNCSPEDFKPAAALDGTRTETDNARRLSFDYVCPSCRSVHTITITVTTDKPATH